MAGADLGRHVVTSASALARVRLVPALVLALILVSLWLIAGVGPLGGELAKELARRGLAERVRLIGFRSDVPALLAAADLFCLTSRREGVPVAILEACGALARGEAANDPSTIGIDCETMSEVAN